MRLQGHDEYHYIKELYPEPIMERAFVGPPNMPGKRGGGGGRGRSNRSAAAAAPSLDALAANPYDAAGLGLWPGMMPGAMHSPGMSPFGFPPMRGIMPGMMPGGLGGMQLPMPGGGARYTGRIKSFNTQKGFGFIECAEAHQVYSRDVFLHKAQVGNFQIGTLVTFGVEMNKNNMPQARDLEAADPYFGGMMGGVGFPGGGIGGAGMGGRGSGKGAGKGRGRGNQKKGEAKKKPGGGEKKAGGGSPPPSKAAAPPPEESA